MCIRDRLDKPALEARLQTAKTLRGWAKTLLRAAAPDADTAFKVLREQFGTLSEARDTAQQRASAALEAAFDFMEQALSLIHISEPTRRTPNSYAGFCLKKKKKKKRRKKEEDIEWCI